MVAMQIARDPLVRQCVRQTFYERAKVNIKPTKKGKKVSFIFLVLYLQFIKRFILVFYYYRIIFSPSCYTAGTFGNCWNNLFIN